MYSRPYVNAYIWDNAGKINSNVISDILPKNANRYVDNVAIKIVSTIKPNRSVFTGSRCMLSENTTGMQG